MTFIVFYYMMLTDGGNANSIIPWVAILYLMLSLDRNNIGNARLGTLEEDLHLGGNDYYTALTIFFAGKLQRQRCDIHKHCCKANATPKGYVIFHIPSNLMVKR